MGLCDTWTPPWQAHVALALTGYITSFYLLRHAFTSSLHMDNNLAPRAYILILGILTPRGMMHHLLWHFMYFMYIITLTLYFTRKEMFRLLRPLITPSYHFIHVISWVYVSSVREKTSYLHASCIELWAIYYVLSLVGGESCSLSNPLPPHFIFYIPLCYVLLWAAIC